MSTRLSGNLGSAISQSLFAQALNQDYQGFLSSNSSDIVAAANLRVGRIIVALSAIFQAVSSAVVCLAGFTVIIVVSRATGLTLLALMGIIYLSIAASVKGKVAARSKLIGAASASATRLIKEAMSFYRESYFDNVSGYFKERFTAQDKQYRLLQSSVQFTAGYPRYLIEGIFLSLLVTAVSYINHSSANGDLDIGMEVTVALIGLLKVVPNLNSVYAGWSTYMGYRGDFEYAAERVKLKGRDRDVLVPILGLDNSLDLIGACFSYQEEYSSPILSNVTLSIIKGDKVCILGETGCGKSTLCDLMMGLLAPSSGRITVDGISLDNSNSIQWSRSIAHVPQSIFLADASIEENIALGVERKTIDYLHLNSVIAIAQLGSLIESLPDGLNTNVGEDGSRLSGGQKQRIGIARALYKRKSVLFLDEATNALDQRTEDALLEHLFSVYPEMTVVSITHRKSSARYFNKSLIVANGHVRVVDN